MTDDVEQGPVTRTHTVCDLHRYSPLVHGDQFDAQRDLIDILDKAARHGKLPRAKALIQPAGDGELVRWPEGTSAIDVLAHYLPPLRAELDRANGRLLPERWIRLRLAVVFGTSEIAKGGLAGDPPVIANRLVNASQARARLVDHPECPLVVVVDDPIYQDIVSREVAYLNPDDYERVEVRDQDKEFSRVAWITSPGLARGRSAQRGRVRESRPPPVRQPWVRLALIAMFTTITAAVVASIVAFIIDSASSAANQTWTETAGNRAGSPTFLDNRGTGSGAGRIPFGTKVQVSCYMPNESGMTSINALYRIETPPWQGQYAPANTFTNGDVLGEVGTHDIDEAVPPC